MGLSEVLGAMMRQQQLKEMMREESARAITSPEVATKLFEMFPKGLSSLSGETMATGPSLAGAIENPTGHVNLPGFQRPGEIPSAVENAFQNMYDVPLRNFRGMASPGEVAAGRERAQTPVLLERSEAEIPIGVKREAAQTPEILKRAKGTSDIELQRQKDYADYIKKIYPDKGEHVRTRETMFFDDMFNIQNWHADSMHAIRQDPRAMKDPKIMQQFAEETNRTMLDKVRALENQYPDIIKSPKAQRALSKVKALGIISPVYPQRKK